MRMPNFTQKMFGCLIWSIISIHSIFHKYPSSSNCSAYICLRQRGPWSLQFAKYAVFTSPFLRLNHTLGNHLYILFTDLTIMQRFVVKNGFYPNRKCIFWGKFNTRLSWLQIYDIDQRFDIDICKKLWPRYLDAKKRPPSTLRCRKRAIPTTDNGDLRVNKPAHAARSTRILVPEPAPKRPMHARARTGAGENSAT